MAESKNKPVNLHVNHRQRMWTQFEKSDGAGFNPHQLLEMLLFFSIRRRDTNPTAHLILNEFGTLRNLMDARPEDLTKVHGVGPSTARLLSLLPVIYDRYMEEIDDCSIQMRSYAEIIDYLTPLLQDVQTTTSYLLILDGRGRPRPLVKLLQDCRFSCTPETQRLISQRILEHTNEIHGVILIEKRFSASHLPDTEDLFTARRLYRFTSNLKVKLLDYIILANGESSSMKRMNMLR